MQINLLYLLSTGYRYVSHGPVSHCNEKPYNYYMNCYYFQTLEGKTIGVARHVTTQLRNTIKSVTTFMPAALQPAAIQERLREAQKFTEELYQSFQQVWQCVIVTKCFLCFSLETQCCMMLLTCLSQWCCICPFWYLLPERSVGTFGSPLRLFFWVCLYVCTM